MGIQWKSFIFGVIAVFLFQWVMAMRGSRSSS